jgi:hypothetical protein
VNAETQAALVSHLSKEIEVATQVQIAQRTKNNLAVAFGPYVLLGAYLLAMEKVPVVSRVPVLGIVAFILIYGSLGWLAGRIEARIWEQCNHWRTQIAQLTGMKPDQLVFDSRGILWSYILVYAALGAVFCGLIGMIEYLA